MRSINGWRFLLVIALPIFLASFGVIALTYDLLDRAAVDAEETELTRSRDLIIRAMNSAEADLGKLTQDNARWDDAYNHVYPKVDPVWFRDTWGHLTETGTPYDIIAIFSASSSKVEAIVSRDAKPPEDITAYIGNTFTVLNEQMSQGHAQRSVATGLALTAEGPAIVAMALITPETSWLQSDRDSAKKLLMLRHVSSAMTDKIERDYLINGLEVVPIVDLPVRSVEFDDVAGLPAFAMAWQHHVADDGVMEWARQKAGAVLVFLVLVMGGIVLVCWRLLQNLAANEERARHDALHDTLTGLPNRAALLEHVRTLRVTRQSRYAIAFADLDGFKEVNDSYGHEVGDQLIKRVGTAILRLVDYDAFLCRMGGDEFVVVCSGDDSEQRVRKFAARLIEFLAQTFDIEGRIMSVGASVGIASSAGEEFDEQELLRRADIAMYKAKAEGKNRACIYNESYDLERSENLAIAEELRDILGNGSLEIAFQPVMDAKTQHMTGVEALARWPSTSRRRVTPDKFISVAEQSGLIDDVGAQILDLACGAARTWPELRLAVNISAVQLNNPSFVPRALDIVAKHGRRPRQLEFEITETSLIRDAERAKSVFKQLHLAGIKVALDDFGTGFSSIGYLRTFNFDRIKIDKSIVSKVLSNPAELAIVQGTLLVARGLSAEVTAEGVENEAEVALLRLAGCTELQGFYFHQPLAAEGITALLETTRRKALASTAA